MTLYYVAAVGLGISVLFDKQKTFQALKIAWKKFSKILPTYIKLLIVVSLVLLVTDKVIINFLGEASGGWGLIIGMVLGSITMMPGFVAYPLAGILLSRGISYMVVAGFVTTLMMVGVATYPVEKEYFGTRATVLRNAVGFVLAFIIALTAGILYGEVF